MRGSGTSLIHERFDIKENFENDGLRNGKIRKKKSGNGDASERIFLVIVENYMLRNGKFRAEKGSLSRGTYPIWKLTPTPGICPVYLCEFA